MTDAHPVKTERHDTGAYIHETNTGRRAVQVYREHVGGLYVSRPFTQHPHIAHWQAHLLPGVLPGGLGVQVCRYDFHAERQHDYYLDVAHITRQAGVWSVRDLYLDVLLWDGLGAQLVDAQELDAAQAAGYLGAEEAEQARAAAQEVLDALARHGYRLDGWLDSLGVRLEWAERDSTTSGERELQPA